MSNPSKYSPAVSEDPMSRSDIVKCFPAEAQRRRGGRNLIFKSIHAAGDSTLENVLTEVEKVSEF